MAASAVRRTPCLVRSFRTSAILPIRAGTVVSFLQGAFSTLLDPSGGSWGAAPKRVPRRTARRRRTTWAPRRRYPPTNRAASFVARGLAGRALRHAGTDSADVAARGRAVEAPKQSARDAPPARLRTNAVPPSRA